MAVTDAHAARVLTTALLFAMALGFLYIAYHTLIAFLFAILFAYLVDPAVARIEKLTHSRGIAIAVIYVLFLGVLSTFFFFVGPRIARQAQKLGESLPNLLQQVSSGQIAQQLGAQHGWSLRTSTLVQSLLLNYREDLLGIAQRIGIRVAEIAKNSWLLVVVPILAVFFLKDGRAFSEVVTSFVRPQAKRELLQGVLDDLHHMLAHFIRAQLSLAALSFVAYIAFMGILRVPYALMLSTAGGFMEFIPVVGPLLAALLIIVVALLMSYKHWLAVVIFLGIWRLVQDYVVSPRIMGKSVELHPLAAIFGVLAGGEIAGVLGVYLSIPVMASLRILWRRWRLYAEKKRFGPLNEYFGTEITPRQ